MVNTPDPTYTVIVFHGTKGEQSGFLAVEDHVVAWTGIPAQLAQIGVREASIVAMQHLSEDKAVQLQVTLMNIDLTRVHTVERLAALLRFQPIPTYPKSVRESLVRYVPHFSVTTAGAAKYEAELKSVLELYRDLGDDLNQFEIQAEASLTKLKPEERGDVMLYFHIFLHEYGASLQEYQADRN